ncbi:MAG: hypothetical protein HN842_10560 [Gammaproteobacteria bacterium]|nr:hypothetical protein [Gammaproteobacteria bacterium]
MSCDDCNNSFLFAEGGYVACNHCGTQHFIGVLSDEERAKIMEKAENFADYQQAADAASAESIRQLPLCDCGGSFIDNTPLCPACRSSNITWGEVVSHSCNI